MIAKIVLSYHLEMKIQYGSVHIEVTDSSNYYFFIVVLYR